jgi:hypothetical protein
MTATTTKSEQTPLQAAIKERDMDTVGEWRFVDKEIESMPGPIIASVVTYNETSNPNRYINYWLHSDEQTLFMISDQTKPYDDTRQYYARVHIHAGNGSSGFTCGIGERVTGDPRPLVDWLYERMTELSSTADLYDVETTDHRTQSITVNNLQ